MADLKISDMTTASSVSDGDIVPIVQTSTNKKSAFSVIKTYLQSAFNALYVPLTRTLTINGTAHDLSADRSWTVPAFTAANLTAAGTDGIAITGGSSAVNGSGTSIAQHVADATHNGYLSSLDWSTFNAGGSGNAPNSAHYLTSQTEAGLTNEVSLGALTTGLLKHTVSSGVSTPATAVAGTDYADNAFKAIAVTGQSNVVADSASDTLTLVAGTNMTITTNAGTDSIIFDAAGGGGSQIGGVTFGLKRSSGIVTGKLGGYWTCPYAGSITAWNITVDAGTVTIKVWKIAAGTAHPTSADSINTSGLALSTGTHLRSTTLSDFTSTIVTSGDTFAIEVTAVSGVFDLGGSIEITH